MGLNTGVIGGYNHANITTTTTTVVKTGEGILHTITLNTKTSTGTITVYDNTSADGTPIMVITSDAVVAPTTLIYDLHFKTGLTVVTGTAAQDVTVSYI